MVDFKQLLDNKLAARAFAPTVEQEAIITAARRGENCMVDAKAGCAKTTTLTLMASAMPIRPSLALAFNKKIVNELEAKFPAHFDVKTMNGLGHQAWSRAIGKRCAVDTKKIGGILKEVLKSMGIGDSTTDEFVEIIRLVGRARVMGLVPRHYSHIDGLIDDNFDGWQEVADTIYTDISDTQAEVCSRVLHRCVQQSYDGVIDYDDQIYMSALFGGVFNKYPVVMVDEAQDLSPLNHIQLSRCALGQVIVVGDPRQAIYAFRGADSSSMDNLRKLRPQWTDLPLSTTFRCPKAIVARQQVHAPGFNAAPEAPDGTVRTIEGLWSGKTFEDCQQLAILCRNNAPLMGAAMRIIASGIGCTILGRELGKALAKLLQSICNDDDSAEVAISKIHDWAEKTISKDLANQKEERVAITEDKRDCLTAILSHKDISRVDRAVSAINRMFLLENLRITLATGHKAKGLEWHTVLHLDSWRIPSRHARQALENGNPIPMEQDMNLRYVIETRTKDTLVMGNMEDME